MPFDKDIRNNLANMVVQCRRLLIRDVAEQLQETFGIQPNGTALPLDRLTHLNEDQLGQAQALREMLAHYAAMAAGSAEEKNQSAYDRMVLEMAFTALNRLAALRLCEERGLLHECIRSGMASEGFQLFDRLAGGALGTRFEAYKVFLSFLFDELSVDLGILFDRSSPQSLIFPRERCLEDVLALLNQDSLKGVWIEDETIGWIYQYFNPSEERKAMREASAAPRNSRELAVRNQFFTPRYVVEFLTDNTLGRIWYEMNQGETKLRDQCRYLVRRPNEIFLQPGEAAPEQPQQDNLSQEELLRQPVYIPHRPLKDPREILMLDPACGSMHFGLYAFDLFEVIYEEAWDIAHGADDERRTSQSLASFMRFVAQYRDRATFLADVPRLIIEQNVHGIDIDFRCVQISALSLWLRAQRSWQKQGLRPQDRPRIRRSNIVCAEPMPGEEAFLQEFIEQHLAAVPERKLLGQLVRRVFDAMKLAGEAGSLVKIEEEIAGAVAEAKRKWLAAPKPEQTLLFSNGTAGSQREILGLDVTGITDEAFWEKVEGRIYEALQRYAELTEHGGYQRRLFAGDAAHGFAFIDICRKRYDLVLMNPPFGLECLSTTPLLRAYYESAYNDMFSCFVARGSLFSAGGLLGAITSRAVLVRRRQAEFRQHWILPSLSLLLDLGNNVMDDALVQSCAFVLHHALKSERVFVFDWRSRSEAERAFTVLEVEKAMVFPVSRAAKMPFNRIVYSLPPKIIALFKSGSAFEPTFGLAKEGMKSFDNFRFLRLSWEVDPINIGFPNGWVRFAKGGEVSAYRGSMHLVLNRCKAGAELDAMNLAVNGSTAQVNQASSFWGYSGCTYSRRSKYFAARALPSQCVFSDKGPAILPSKETSANLLLAWLNSAPVRALVHFQANASDYLTGIIKTLPFPSLQAEAASALELIGHDLARERRESDIRYEVDPEFRYPMWLGGLRETFDSFGERCTERNNIVARRETEASRIVAIGYGIEDWTWSRELLDEDTEDRKDSDDDEIDGQLTLEEFAADSVSLHLGTALGRWDIRFATGERPAPELADPFAPLPVCPPGQLQNEQGLPITKEDVERLKEKGRWNYPIDIPWEGVLVDDPGHPLDIEARVREVLQIIWKDSSEAIEREACEILGVGALRDYFRKPNGFFADHLKRYSKSRRQAPLYWPLSTASGSYTIWLYYHRLSEDTLYTVVNRFVAPKIASIERDIARLETELTGTSGRDASRVRGKIEEADSLLNELHEFREELLRIAGLPHRPNLNDGVIINASPFHRLFRLRSWAKDTEEIWRKLERGEYDWAHLAYTIWPDRVREVCKRDRSIAIAHGLEELYEGPVQPVRSKRTKQKAAYPSEPELPYAKVAEEVPRSMDAKGRILTALHSAAEPLGKSQLIEAAGIAASAWSPAMRSLKDEGLVEQIGEKRNAVYRIKEGH